MDVVQCFKQKEKTFISFSMLTFDRTKVLGKGAFGIVYEGVWDGNTVAVKRIPMYHAATDEQEEKALKILDHINVNKLFYVQNGEDFKY